jgi:hypothetical protein
MFVSQVMKSTERHFFQNTERTYHCIIMHIFKKQKQKQSIIKLNKQSINAPSPLLKCHNTHLACIFVMFVGQ